MVHPRRISGEQRCRIGERIHGYTPLGDYDALVGDSIGWLRDIYGQDSGHRFSALAAYPFDLFDYAREDAFLAAQTGP